VGSTKRKILDLSGDLVGSLPGRCSRCCYWESATAGEPGACHIGEGKADWVTRCLAQGISPGKLLQIDGVTYAYIQHAPARQVPRLMNMLYPRPSEDALYISCIYVDPELRGRGLGKLLIASVVRSQYRGKMRGLETHGISSARSAPPGPAGFFEACGFRIVSKHLEAPLMRMDFKALAPLQEGVQSLLERLPLPSLARHPVPGSEAR